MKNLIYPFFVNITFFAFLFFLISIFFYFLNKKIREFFLKIFRKFGYLMIFFIAFFSTFGSLLFSDVLNWLPCKLCWYQRIFMYPQVAISLIALKLKDKNGYFYHFWLSFFGFLIAFFHYLIQIGIIKNIDCNLAFTSNTCGLKINFAFGFISIPFMSTIAFLIIVFISLLMIKNKLKY